MSGWSLYDNLPPAAGGSGAISSSGNTTETVIDATAAASSAPTSTPTPVKDTTLPEWTNNNKLLAPQLRRKAAAAAVKPKPPVKKTMMSSANSTANNQLQKLKQTQNNLKQRESLEEETASQQSIAQDKTAVVAHDRPASPELQIDPSDSAQSSQSIFGDATNIYDPAKPNDFMRLMEERKTQAKKARAAAARAAAEEFRPPPTYNDDEDDRYRRDSPDRSPERQPSPKRVKMEAPAPEKSGNTGGSSVIARMMAKMGYKEGQGLGKTEGGILAPLIVKKTDGRSGVIVVGETKTGLLKIPKSESTVVVLTNMVGAGEVDSELERETKEECTTKYGPVSECIVHEVKKDGTPANEAVKIYVKFEKNEQAKKAIDDLNGRFFGGRKVAAQLFEEHLFYERKF